MLDKEEVNSPHLEELRGTTTVLSVCWAKMRNVKDY